MIRRKTSVVIFLCSFLCFIFFSLLFHIHSKQSPEEYILKHSSGDDALSPTEFLAQEDLGDNKSLIFFINTHGRAACMVLEKELFSYKQLCSSAELYLDNDAQSYLYSKYDKKNDWIVWNIIHDSQINGIMIDGKMAEIVDTAYSFKIFYVIREPLSPRTEAPSYNIIYKKL